MDDLVYKQESYQTILYRLRDTDHITRDKCSVLFDQYKSKFGFKEPSPLKDPLHFNQENKIELEKGIKRDCDWYNEQIC